VPSPRNDDPKKVQQASTQANIKTLCFDIGGSHIKAILLDGAPHGRNRLRVDTPRPARPDAVCEALEALAAQVGPYDRLAAGFPGVVKNGHTLTAPNLHDDWLGFPLGLVLSQRFHCPVRVANDADVQGLAAIQRRGVELVITFGTGMGSALYIDGRLIPNLQLAHHLFRNKRTYEDFLGLRGLKKSGRRKWNRNVAQMIDMLLSTFNYDRLYLGGGNARKIDIPLPKNVEKIDNIDGLVGGLKLWLDEHIETIEATATLNRRAA
jgi:polyphosphate glucokinase